VTAREEVLARIRAALADGPASDPAARASGHADPAALANGPAGDPAVPRAYLRSHADGDLTDLFAERVADYRAVVSRVTVAGVPAAIASAATALGLAEVIAAPGLPPSWLPDVAGVRWLADDPPLTVEALDRCGAAVTTAALGIAVTGTIVLDARAGQGRRALTLVPDVHLCVLRADQIVADVPDALARLDPHRPLTFISGPSATSDIELERVEGVHGPRTLHVIIAEGDTG
jgi:L-lactate dehydrogenase complex protein LldG